MPPDDRTVSPGERNTDGCRPRRNTEASRRHGQGRRRVVVKNNMRLCRFGVSVARDRFPKGGSMPDPAVHPEAVVEPPAEKAASAEVNDRDRLTEGQRRSDNPPALQRAGAAHAVRTDPIARGAFSCRVLAPSGDPGEAFQTQCRHSILSEQGAARDGPARCISTVFEVVCFSLSRFPRRCDWLWRNVS